jgi:hypothetical protein
MCPILLLVLTGEVNMKLYKEEENYASKLEESK